MADRDVGSLEGDDLASFQRLGARLDYPMAVVTTVGRDGTRAGCLVGFHTQCSIDPPRWFVAVSINNHTHGVISRADVAAVHLLSRADLEVARLFGAETGDDTDKFARCEWSSGPGDVPVLRGVSWIAGPIVERIEGGDHLGVIVAVDAVVDLDAGAQLGFQVVKDMSPGHRP